MPLPNAWTRRQTICNDFFLSPEYFFIGFQGVQSCQGYCSSWLSFSFSLSPFLPTIFISFPLSSQTTCRREPTKKKCILLRALTTIDCEIKRRWKKRNEGKEEGRIYQQGIKKKDGEGPSSWTQLVKNRQKWVSVQITILPPPLSPESPWIGKKQQQHSERGRDGFNCPKGVVCEA